jgi:hypothetical protein
VALEHDPPALEDARVRATVEAVGALLARRLQAAAGAARHAAEVAASRQRLVEAEDAERRQLAGNVADGPGRWLEQARTVLDAVLVTSDLPADAERTRRQAREQAVAAQGEMLATVRGDLDRLLTRRGPATVLATSASRTSSAHPESAPIPVGSGSHHNPEPPPSPQHSRTLDRTESPVTQPVDHHVSIEVVPRRPRSIMVSHREASVAHHQGRPSKGGGSPRYLDGSSRTTVTVPLTPLVTYAVPTAGSIAIPVG